MNNSRNVLTYTDRYCLDANLKALNWMEVDDALFFVLFFFVYRRRQKTYLYKNKRDAKEGNGIGYYSSREWGLYQSRAFEIY